MTTKRLLLVHAHPDDESSQSAATMARYVSEGAQVTLVTCTLGEYGDVVHPELEHVKGAENLGSHRLAELTEAMAALGLPVPASPGEVATLVRQATDAGNRRTTS